MDSSDQMQANKDFSIKVQLPTGELLDVADPCIDLVAFVRKPFEEWISFYEEIYGAFLSEFGSQFTYCNNGGGKWLKATKNQLTKSLKWKEDPKFHKTLLFHSVAHSGTGLNAFWNPKAPAFDFFQAQLCREDISGDISGHIKLSFPLNYDANKIIAFIKKHFKGLALSSGYCGYSLVCDENNVSNKAWSAHFVELLNQYPGLNHPNVGRIGAWTMDRLLIIGWLTFLGKNLIKEMGGVKKIKKDLGKDFIFHSLGNSLCIQAGEEPQLGANGADSLPLYQKLGKYLNPIRPSDETIEGIGLAGVQSDTEELNWYLRFFITSNDTLQNLIGKSIEEIAQAIKDGSISAQYILDSIYPRLSPEQRLVFHKAILSLPIPQIHETKNRSNYIRAANDAIVALYELEDWTQALEFADRFFEEAFQLESHRMNLFLTHSIGAVYVKYGKKEKALQLIEHAVKHDYINAASMETDSSFAELNKNPRFTALFKEHLSKKDIASLP